MKHGHQTRTFWGVQIDTWVFFTPNFYLWWEMGYSQVNCISSWTTMIAGKLFFFFLWNSNMGWFWTLFASWLWKKQGTEQRAQVVQLIAGAFLLFNRILLTLQWANELSLNSSTASSYTTDSAGFSMIQRIAVDERRERQLPGIFICREISREALLHPHPIPVSILFWLAQHLYNPVQENRRACPPKAFYNLKWGKV